MSALAHYLEEEGIATVAISLIRPQTENTKPPRALWVPFELGRPIGAPADSAFQKRIIKTALQMLERADGPVILDDYQEEDPRNVLDPVWKPPFIGAFRENETNVALAERFEAEVESLRPAYERRVRERHRTTVGLARMPADRCARYIAEWLRGGEPPSPLNDLSAPLVLRFCVDDIKAYCLEAAAASDGKPSGRQLRHWFWNETASAAAIYALRKLLQTKDDKRLSQIVSTFMVPAAYVRDND